MGRKLLPFEMWRIGRFCGLALVMRNSESGEEIAPYPME